VIFQSSVKAEQGSALVELMVSRWEQSKARQVGYVPPEDVRLRTGAADDVNTLVMRRGLIVDDLLRMQRAMLSCGTSREFSISKDFKVSRTGGHSCGRTKYCKICSNRATMKRRETIRKARRIISNKKARYVYMLTFTQDNAADIYEAIARFQSSFRRWSRMGQKDRNGEYSKIIAGVKSIEVKRGGGSGLQHVHAHVLVWCNKKIEYSTYWHNWENVSENQWTVEKITEEMKKRYNKKPLKRHLKLAAKCGEWRNGTFIPMSKISKEWKNASGAVNIRVDAIGSGKYQSEESAITETLKYALKTTDYLDSENSRLFGDGGRDLLTALDALRGVRQVEMLGVLRSVESGEVNTPESVSKLERAARRRARRAGEMVAPDPRISWNKFEDGTRFFAWRFGHDVLDHKYEDITGRRRSLSKFQILMSGVRGMRARIVGQYRHDRSWWLWYARANNLSAADTVAGIRARGDVMKTKLARLNNKFLQSLQRLRALYGSYVPIPEGVLNDH